MLRLVCLGVYTGKGFFFLRNKDGRIISRARLASSQQSSMARTHSKRSGLKDDCGSARCNSEPPGKMESRAFGRTDNRDCLGAWYDILKDPHTTQLIVVTPSASGRALARVGGVGVKNSNPDQPDALISEPKIVRSFSLKCSLDPSETSAPAQRFTLLVTLLSGRRSEVPLSWRRSREEACLLPARSR